MKRALIAAALLVASTFTFASAGGEQTPKVEPFIGQTRVTPQNTTWGTPQSIETITFNSFVFEKWTYADGKTLAFKNGRLFSIKN